MSKTWKKFDGWKDRGHDARTAAARELRRKSPLIPISNGNEYRRHYPQWDICDWNCSRSPAAQKHVYHNPHESWACICSLPLYSTTTRVPWDAPNPELIDRNYVLPIGYTFSRRYMSPEQRVNPETGDYEKKVSLITWEFVGTRASNAKFVFGTSPHYWRKSGRIEWRQKSVDTWIHNDSPEVYRLVERPFFTEEEVKRHVKDRERDTRNVRYHQHWPRYWRRDRKRARWIKGGLDSQIW